MLVVEFGEGGRVAEIFGEELLQRRQRPDSGGRQRREKGMGWTKLSPRFAAPTTGRTGIQRRDKVKEGPGLSREAQ